MSSRHPQAPRQGGTLSLLAFAALCAVVSIAGGWVTAGSVKTWYPTLAKPVFTPPDWLFAPVWTILFALIAIAGWRIWRRRYDARVTLALRVYALQLALNLAWSVLFFGLQRVDLAALEIVGLSLAIAWNMVLFHRIDRVAAYLLAPYLVWVGYAALLTISIWRLNP